MFIMNQDVVVAISFALSAAVGILSTFRLKNRIAQGQIKIEDYVLIPSALALAVMLAGLRTVVTKGYMNRQIIDMPLTEIITLLKGYFWMELIYICCIALLKCSILLSYRRILHPYPKLRYANYIVLGLQMAWGISMFFSTMFQCVPMSKFWDPTSVGGYCSGADAIALGKNIPDVLLNALVLGLPVVAIFKTDMSQRQKKFMTGSLVLGFAALVASMFRAALLPQMWLTDIPRLIVLLIFVSNIECSTAMIAANLPFLSAPEQRLDFTISDQSRDLKVDSKC